MFAKRSRRVARIVCGTMLTLTVALGAVARPVAAASTATWQYHQLDADRLMDAATLDSNFNGRYDQIWIDVDNDGRWDTHLYNTVGGDELLEVLDYDFDEDGTVEYRFVDTNQREGFDLLYVNRNDDGSWDGPAVAVSPVTPSASVSLLFPATEIRSYSFNPCIFSAAIHC